MSFSENYENSFLMLTPDGVNDWDCKTNYPHGLKVWSVLFYSSAANDVLCIKEGGDTGPIVFKAKDVDGSGLLSYLAGNNIFPYIDGSECKFGITSNVRITFYMV